MARGGMIGIGAAGAAIAAVATGVAVNNRSGAQPETASPAEAVSAEASRPTPFCLRSNFNLVEGMDGACLTPAQYSELRGRAVIDQNGSPVELSLSAPAGGDELKTVRSCTDYDALAGTGWYALSSADMRREGYFNRACGALAWLVRAHPAGRSYFIDGEANDGDIRSMAGSMAIGIGPDAETPAEIEKVGDHAWKLSSSNETATFFEIAHADFSGGGLGEILAYVQTSAVGGTAISGSVGLIEKQDANGPCVFKPD